MTLSALRDKHEEANAARRRLDVGKKSFARRGIASQSQALKHEVSWEASGARSSVTAGHSAVVRRPKKEAASWQTRVASNRSNSPRGEASGRILPVAHPGIPVPHAIHPIKVGAGGVDQQVRV